MEKAKRQFGLLLTTEISYGTRYVKLEIVAREEGHAYPRGVGDWLGEDRPKHLEDLALAGLGFFGFVNDSADHAFIGTEIEYRNVYSINQRLARRMQRTLAKINRALDKACAYEPGDKLIALAKVLRLDFVVERINTKPYGRAYTDSDWRWMTVPEGRHRYRVLIEAAREAAAGKAVAS